MKTFVTILLLSIFSLTLQQGLSQDYASPNKSFSLGVFAGEHGYDMGIGVELGTPAVFKNIICFRVKGGVNWSEIYKATYDHWVKYETISLSMIYNTPMFGQARGRAYFDLGTYLEFPDRKFSDKKTVQGITCSTGVELFLAPRPNPKVSYYCGVGIGYTRAYAEKLENKRYGNGFVFNNGFRFYF